MSKERSLVWPLVGRDQEIKEFEETLSQDHILGHLVCGPPGVGKTRLAQQFLNKAVQAGFQSKIVTASAAASAVPLGAVAHLFPVGEARPRTLDGFFAIAKSLSVRNRRRTLVLVDDLPFLDNVSAMLLRQLLDARLIRLVATANIEGLASRAVQALARGDAVHRIDLLEFGQDTVESVLTAALGGSIERHTVRTLADASQGNISYLRELVRAALDSATLVHDGELWRLITARPPRTRRLNELVTMRLEAAGSAARPALDVLALCGPLPLTDVETVVSVETLTDLERLRLIRTQQDGRRTLLNLAHPLYRDVLRDAMPALHRRTTLLNQARHVESCGSRRRADVRRVAQWKLAATGQAEPHLLLRAANDAREAHDCALATSFLEALPDRHHSTDTRLMLAESYLQIGDSQRVEKTLAEVELTATSERDKVAITLVRAANLVWNEADVVQARAINDTALSSVSALDLQRVLKVNAGWIQIADGQLREGLALLDNIGADRDPDVDSDLWARATLMKCAGLAMSGCTQEAMDWADHAYGVHRRIQEHVGSPAAIQHIASFLARSERGPSAEVLTGGAEIYAQLPEASSVPRAWLALFNGRARWLAGHPASARRWYAEAASASRVTGHPALLRMALSGVTACAAQLGDLKAAQAAHHEFQEIPRGFSTLLSVGEESLGEAWLLVASGCVSQARSVLTKAAKTAGGSGHLASQALLLTEIARLGGQDHVRESLAELVELSDSPFVHARAELAAGLAADNPTQLMKASHALEGAGADLLAAEAATAAAAAWRRTAQSRRATAASNRAEALAGRCESAQSPLLAAAQTGVTLTAREREVALLAAAGRASKEIAQLLKLSVRTVDNHLYSTYAKLGITARSELEHALGVQTNRKVLLPRQVRPTLSMT